MSHYGKYQHCEAITVGQVAAAEISAALLNLPQIDLERITGLFRRAGLPTSVDLNKRQMKQLFAAMRLDKKVSDGQIKFVLARRIGEVQWAQNVPDELIRETLNPQLSVLD
jgi:3-dehydroquinate synthase